MREMIGRINPALIVEDQTCAFELPRAILTTAQEKNLDWLKLFTLAWQESDFDCHAKNPKDKGGAYGPYQIRRLWKDVAGDPRHRYFDPHMSTNRVAAVLHYYQETPRFGELVERRFKNPLLCLYNSGEPNRVNMKYCRKIGKKLNKMRQAWQEFHKGSLVAVEDRKSLPNALIVE